MTIRLSGPIVIRAVVRSQMYIRSNIMMAEIEEVEKNLEILKVESKRVTGRK